ncbi:MAG: type secretion protein VasK [Pseudomonadota bacterium]|jgi:type VI secretion system protein ImpL
MQKIWSFLLDTRTLAVIGLAALAAFLLLGADTLKVGLIWALAVLASLLLIWGVVWGVRRWRAHKAGRQLEAAMDAESARAVQAAPDKESRAEITALRERMQEAVKTIKTSKLGLTSGSAAMYELPWYAVIGNPAAGKSTAVVRSGLNFPFSDKSMSVIQGIGGTRNCDWFFTTEGILLDTAGRYAIHEEDRGEWLGFLSLLKRNRPKAPLNGVIIAASLSELSSNRPEFAIALAKQLRQRVQELTEKLEVFAPVYVVFTKADLISGFTEFFDDRDPEERERVWGATLPYDTAVKTDAVAAFERHFDELNDGLKEASVVRMSMHRGDSLPPGVLTFPLEFAALKAPLRTFISTLFEDNPYQFRPIFRGFYFTSAVQEGESTARASRRVAERFALSPQREGDSVLAATAAATEAGAQGGFFLRDLFSKVIFADQKLVQQYTSRSKLRWRYAAFLGGALLLGTALAGWTWSYVGNRQLVANVQADLNKAIKLQEGRVDLQSRLQALEIVQDRVGQLQRYREERPWTLTLGLYQGDAVEERLRATYLAGLQEVMLKPTSQTLASYLGEVNSGAANLKPVLRTPGGSPANGQGGDDKLGANSGVYVAASPTSVPDAYNALKAYIMLGDRSRMEPGHLGDQATRFWRVWLEANRGAMPREDMIRSAEHIMSFALTQVSAPDFPEVQTNLAVLDTTRENLRRVVKGMPAVERVYAEIKARAATRYPTMTVARLVEDADKDIVAGSYAISGTFTREAWEGFIDDAFKEASTKESQADDWVLKAASADDLTLEGSPEQIRKALVQLYKSEYVVEWQKFMQGVSVKEFRSFEQAVVSMNRLGDPAASPVGKLIQALYDQTSWDNPSILNDRLAKGQKTFVDWFKQSIMRMAPSQMEVKVDMTTGQAAIPMGPIGKEFAGLTRLMVSRDSTPTLIRNYLQALSKVRTRFNQMKNQGDAGPPSRQLMLQTLEGTSELSEALKLVEEQMLNGQTEAAKATLRPLLVRPLIQSFAVIVAPAETEINRVWAAQVYEPFQRTLAGKYPFDKASRMEATGGEIAKVFGPEGSVAKFSEQALGALVVRRGDTVTPRTWAEIGLQLRPEFAAGFPSWVAALPGQAGGGGASAGGGGGGGGAGAAPAAASDQQTRFQILPTPVPGLSEYTIEIDGQQLRYRNGVASWTDFVWPGQGTPGVRITGVTTDGRPVEFLNEPGAYGLEKMLGGANRRRVSPGWFELTWRNGNVGVTAQLKLIASPTSSAPAAGAGSAAGGAAGGAAPDTPSASGSLRGAQLPAQVVGGGAAVATVAGATPVPVAPSSAAASGVRP